MQQLEEGLESVIEVEPERFQDASTVDDFGKVEMRFPYVYDENNAPSASDYQFNLN